MKNLVTILTDVRLTNLGVPMSYLQENGIECLLKDENFGEMYPGIGVQLQVDEADAEKALSLLIEGGFAKKEDYEQYSDPLTRLVDKLFGADDKKE